MEKIKQAIEMARQKRAQKPSPPPKTRKTYKDSVQPIEEKITYNQTKMVDLNTNDLKNNRIILIDDNDEITNAYKVLRTQVIQRLRANQWNSLAVTSPTKGNGKTLTAINLAISLSREVNHSVLLVDMDLRRPSIHTYFSLEDLPSIGDYLTEGKDLSEILFNPGIERLVVLPGNQTFTNSSEMLSSPKMVHLVEELKTRYPNRIVIFDMPPLLSCDDMIAFSPYIDAILLVVEDGMTKKEDLKRACELMENKNIIGAILNKSVEQGSTYGYY